MMEPTSPTTKVQDISFPLPKNPHTMLQAHLTFFKTCIMLFLTTSKIGESSSSLAPMGSFVYAMPNRLDEKNVISTALYESGSSIDYATRTARILARRTRRPTYVGCSMDFAGTTIEEEMEGLLKVIDTVLAEWNKHKNDLRHDDIQT